MKVILSNCAHEHVYVCICLIVCVYVCVYMYLYEYIFIILVYLKCMTVVCTSAIQCQLSYSFLYFLTLLQPLSIFLLLHLLLIYSFALFFHRSTPSTPFPSSLYFSPFSSIASLLSLLFSPILLYVYHFCHF